MPRETVKFGIPLAQSIDTDCPKERIYPFVTDPALFEARLGHPPSPHIQHTGIERNGGLTNLWQQQTNFPDAGAVYFRTTGGTLLELFAQPDGKTSLVKANNQVLGTVSQFGVQNRIKLPLCNDAALTATQTYLTVSMNGNVITVSEINYAGTVLNTRSATFSGLPSNIAQIMTSLSFVRYNGQKYSDSQEFALRIGSKVVILQESNSGIQIGSAVQSTTALSPQGTTGFNVLACCTWNGNVVFAGTSGRMASVDANGNWRNYDGSGTGTGPYANGELTNSQDITALCVYTGIGQFGGWLAIGAKTGLVASVDLANGKHAYNSSGKGLWSNQGAIGANNITSLCMISNVLFVSGAGGLVGAYDGGIWYAYNSATNLVNNATVVGANQIECSNLYNNGSYSGIAFGGDGGRLGSAAPTGSVGTPITVSSPPSLVNARPAIATNGFGTVILAAPTEVFQSTDFGLTWTNVTPSSFSGVGISVLYLGQAIFLVLSTAGVWQTINNGSTWTNITPAGFGISLISPFCIAWNNSTTVLLIGQASGASPSYNFGSLANGIITWGSTATISNWASTYIAFACCYIPSNSTWIVVGETTPGGSSNAVYSIYSAGSWSNSTTFSGWGSTGIAYSVYYANGLLMVGGTVGGGSAGTLAYSSNGGSSWTIVTVTGLTAIYGFAYSSTQGWMASGTGGSFGSPTSAYALSSNGTSWGSGTSINAANANPAATTTDNVRIYLVGVTTAPTTTILIFPFGVTWTNYNSGSGLSNNATAISTQNIMTMAQYGSGGSAKLVIAGGGGLVASWNGSAWTNYNAGSGLCSNATVIGANQVNTISVNGAIAIFGGAAGQLGSYDGTNFKNYDGTGTGIGPSSFYGGAQQQLVGTNTIYDAVFATISGNMILLVAAANSVINSISGVGSTNTILVFWNSGSTLLSDLLYGFQDFTYLYVYRYENGMYLVNLTGNTYKNTNNCIGTSFLINNTTKQYYTLNAQYALLQVSGGKSRHVLTYKPAFIGGTTSLDTYGAGLIGYADFSSFSAGVVYPVTGVGSVSAITSVNAAVGYQELTYQVGTSAVYSYSSPQWIPTPSALFNPINQTNQSTLINFYGKLTNGFGAPTAQPYEIRWCMQPQAGTGSAIAAGNPGIQSYLSVAMLTGGAQDNMGVMLTGVGETDNTYTPEVVEANNQSAILYRYANQLFLINIGQSPTAPIQKITDRLYKLNTISPVNIYDDIFQVLDLGSMDYNGRMQITNTNAAAATPSYIASQVNDRFSNSIDVGSMPFYYATLANNNFLVIGYQIPYLPQSINFEVLVFFGTNPLGGGYSFGVRNSSTVPIVDGFYTGRSYVSNSTFLPMAVGYTYFNRAVANTIFSTIFLNQVYQDPLDGSYHESDVYTLGNDITPTFQPFVLFNQVYLFDGEWIWLGIFDASGNYLSRTRAANATGLILIAVSPQRAYFLSAFDNSIWTFDGGLVVTKLIRMNQLPTITGGAWNTRDNTLALDTASSIILIRDDIVSTVTRPAGGALSYFDTVNGLIIANNTSQWIYSFMQLAGSTVVPFSWQSAYFGQKNNERSTLSKWHVTIYSGSKAQIMVTLTALHYDEDHGYSESKQFPLVAASYDENGYARLDFTPQQHNVGLGHSIGISAPGAVLVTEISGEYLDAGQAVPGPGKSR